MAASAPLDPDSVDDVLGADHADLGGFLAALRWFRLSEPAPRTRQTS